MRIQIRNCVTDPRFKSLRQQGSPVFKPVILGQALVPGAVRIAESSLFNLSDVQGLESLVNSGSCTALEIGKGPVDFSTWLSTFSIEEEVVEPIAEEEPSEELALEDDDTQSVDEPEEASEDIEESPEESILYSEEDLTEMRNADIRDIILGIDPDAAVSNKSKKRLIALLMELQNG